MRLVRITISTAVVIVGLLAFTATEAAAACAPGQPYGQEPGNPGPLPGPKRPAYPMGQCQLQLSASAASAGSKVTASGSQFKPNSSVAMSVGDQGVGSATADSAGNFTQAFTVPNVAPGSYTVRATGVDSANVPFEQVAELQVTAPAGSSTGSAAGGAAGKGSSAATGGLKSGSGLAAPAGGAQAPAAAGQLAGSVAGEVAGAPVATDATLAGSDTNGGSPLIFGAAAIGLLGVGAAAVLATKKRKADQAA
jgi:hypothetical protein